MDTGVPPHFHKIDRIAEEDVIPDGKIIDVVPDWAAPEGTEVTYKNGGTIRRYKMIDGTWESWDIGASGVSGDNSAVSAFVSGAQAIPATTWTMVEYDTEVFDLNNEFDNAIFSFQPTQAGYYLIHAQIEWENPPSGGGATRGIRLYKNNAVYQNRQGSQDTYDSANPSQSVTDIIYLNGGSDHIEVYCYQDAGGGVNINGDTSYFTAALLMRA